MKLGDKQACIVGVGTSDEFGFDLGKSPMRLQVESFSSALRDAGLRRDHIDGFATAHGSPSGVDYEEFTAAMGLSCRYIDQAWAHGRWATGLVAHAGLAVMAGLANYVAIANTGVTRRGYGRYLENLGGSSTREGLRDTGGGHGEWSVHGLDTPGAATSLVAQRYMDKYDATPTDLARISVGYRENAAKNPMAGLRAKPLTMETYFDEPVISGPFRRSDYALLNEGSTCLIVTTSERARDLPQRPALVAAVQSIRSSRDDYVMFSRPGLGVGFGEEYEFRAPTQPVYGMAGVTQEDLDGLYVYDSFSSNLWMVLERFGFCAAGEAPEWVEKSGVGVSSDLPVNTNGGLMAEGDFTGYAHLIEMVRQLRGTAGARQIANASVLQWATPWGDSLILTA